MIKLKVSKLKIEQALKMERLKRRFSGGHRTREMGDSTRGETMKCGRGKIVWRVLRKQGVPKVGKIALGIWGWVTSPGTHQKVQHPSEHRPWIRKIIALR